MAGQQAEGRERGRRRRLRRVLLILLAAALLGGGFAWWRDQGRHMFFPKNWGVVEAGRIYRSGQIHRRLIEDVLRDHGIRLVIDLAQDEPGHEDEAAEVDAARHLGIRKVDLVSLNGFGTGDVEDYALALREIIHAREAGEPVLVHCAGGSERTGGVFACYRMLFEGWDGGRAWDEYLSYRDRPPKNDYLPRFVNDNLPALVERLQRMDVLAQPPEQLPVFGPAGDAR